MRESTLQSPNLYRTTPYRLDGNLTVRLYHPNLVRAIREKNIPSLAYLALGHLVNYRGFTHATIYVKTGDIELEYGMTWYGLRSESPRNDWSVEIPINSCVKIELLNRLEQVYLNKDLFCTLQTVLGTYFGTKVYGINCSQTVALVLGLYGWQTVTKPENLLARLTCDGRLFRTRIGEHHYVTSIPQA